METNRADHQAILLEGTSSAKVDPKKNKDTEVAKKSVKRDDDDSKVNNTELGTWDFFKKQTTSWEVWKEILSPTLPSGAIEATIPDLPIGPSGAVRVLKNVRNVRKIVVIGENMAENVIPYAKKIVATWFKPTGTNPANWMKNQTNWIRNQIKDPYTQIIDIGRDMRRSDISKYYLKELQMVKKYLGL